MPRLSVVVIARNEEANIRRCLSSASFADELVLYDDRSTDRTQEIATDMGARVFQSDWQGFGQAKREAVARATGEWILSLDADEEVTPQLAEEIRAVLANSSDVAGYYIPRRTEFLGRWIKHCGWYPDRVLRLFRKDKGNFSQAVVHEAVQLAGRTGSLNGEILHYSYPSLDVYFRKMNRYTSLAAREGFEAGRRAKRYDLLVRPWAAFVKHYIFKRGFLDGIEGLLVSVFSACYVLAKYAKMRDLARRGRENTVRR
ncbi:MAG: glycosyltransferase family 2 protein [Candidatus Zixiibacteriota bacterium]|nr:MAG: glycosyltransferase family 2 protein [candidate division Zixibacteria bacterium]